MRNALFFLTLLVSYSVCAQNLQNPDYYLNGRLTDIEKVFINASRIDSMRVDKQSKNGAIYIYTKNNFSYLTLGEVLTKYTNMTKPNDSLLFRIDGKIITDISDIKIDDTFFIYVDIKFLSDLKYISDKFKNLTIVNIDLKKERQILLRGNEDLTSKIAN